MPPAKSADPARSWNRLDGVDILRGLAIFFVLMNHVNMRLLIARIPYTKGLPAQLASSLVWNGQPGVQIFFAVSGFLITSTTLRRWGPLRRVNVRDFYALRFARIAPLLLLLLTVLSVLHFAHLKNFIVPPKTGGLGRALVAALTFHVNVLEASRGYLPANWDILWSLSVEEMFYLFFPLFCRILGRGKLLVAVLLAFVVLGPFGRTALAHGNEVWREYSYLGGMDAIALGCLTALVVPPRRFSGRTLRILGGIGSAILIFSLGFSLRASAWGLGRSGLDMTVLAVGTCLAIVAAAQSQWRSPRLISPLVMLGRRSYEVYLTHMFVVFALFNLFVSAGKPMLVVPVLFAAVILLASVFGSIVARFYSEPMNRMLRQRLGDGAGRLGIGDRRKQSRDTTSAQMKIATYNVNSIRQRLPIVLDWIGQHQPDVMCLQETKVQDQDFPAEAIRKAGYHVAFRGMKGYNGVATLTRAEPEKVIHGLHEGPDNEDCRIIQTVVNGIPIINSYVPQGYAVDSEKYTFKLVWFRRLRRYFESALRPDQPAVWLGDLNVAPEPIDVYHPDKRVNDPDFHIEARTVYKEVVALGFVDVFRKLHPDVIQYTYWDYYRNALQRNFGWRIDHILATAPLAERCHTAAVDMAPRQIAGASDHTIVWAEFD